jgi:hypothetical protein
MNPTREQVLAALLAVVAGAASFQATGRRNRSPEQIGPGQSPAVFLVKAGERYRRVSPNLPPEITLIVKAMLYSDAGPDLNAIPEAPLNDTLDALDAALKPDDPRSGYFTLGGLVTSCIISGEIKCSSGEITGKSLEIVPFEIVLPLSENG